MRTLTTTMRATAAILTLISAAILVPAAVQNVRGAESEAETNEAMTPKKMAWSFSGPFGMYDRAALQRGFQVYKEVCSGCHSLNYIAFRNLGDKGGPEFSLEQVSAIAAMYKVAAEPDDQGKTVDADGMPLMRTAVASDYFPPPYPNEKATRAAMNGALPPDLSLVVKNREGHEDYIYSILTGFGQKAPATMKMSPGMSYNPYFPRRQIAMPQPLSEGAVTFADGTPNTIEQEAHDVVTFLAWASEPKMEERKRTGFRVMLFLLGFTGLLYLAYRKVWHGAH